MASQNVKTAKKGYEAFGAGDVETVLADFDDNIEWTVPATAPSAAPSAAKTGSWNAGEGGGEVIHNDPERYIADDDDVVVLTRVSAGGKSALQADVLTYRNGKVVKAVSFGDTAMQERVFGTK